ncbi:MAG TPA: head GIN domain-containing protein [Bacteroidales bacterium]|nr:head GIN domain-containing protein [Bacteroidales bacterium]
MKTRIIFALLFTFTMFSGYAQETVVRNIDSFDKIEVFGNIRVMLTKGNAGTINIDSKDVAPSEVETKIEDKLLKIKMKSNLFEDVTVNVFVNFDELREITAHGAAEIIIKDKIKADKIIVTATSGGRIKLEANLNAVDLKVYQGGHIDISGKSKIQESYVNTGGVLSATTFECDEVFIKMNTGGNADVFATKKIDAKVNTGATLTVYGKAKQEVLKTSLGGEIIRWNE